MNESRLAFFAYLLMLALGILQWVHVYPQLPQHMASHFAANGTPNGWMPKNAFFLLTVVMTALSALPAVLAPRSITSKSDARLNLPKEDYWLAPEHRQETFRFINAQMSWFSCGILFVLLYGTSQAINANLPGIGYFNSRGMFYVMVGFVLLTLLWTVRLITHFSNTPDSPISAPPRC
jgi:uncharacterized membrane protein